jgi:general secretion pathway protein F
MPDFDYLAIDTRGGERRGSVVAPSIEDARQTLDRRRLYVVRIEPGSGAPKPKASLLSFSRRKLTAKELTLFTRQIATLVQVSPLEEALRTISRQTEKPHVRAITSAVHAGVLEGRRMSDAMAREPKSFPPLYRAMVSAGESSGTLPTILERLADLMERQAQVRS